MTEDEYHIINLNDNTIKCFRDGRVHTLFTYKDGREKWNERTIKPDTNGYIRIGISGKLYRVHRLIMMAFVGESDQQVDHINRIKTDNRLENLRYCTHSENQCNRESVDIAKGYSWERNKWRAYIRINNKQKHLGMFEKEADARQAFLDARLKYSNEL